MATNSSNDFDFSVDDTQTKSTTSSVNSDGLHKHQSSSVGVSHPQIPGDSAPFIVLCGPPASGKSMVLKSLASFLYNSPDLGYTVSANTTLLNTSKYQADCAEFDNIIGNPDTRFDNTVDYLMADVMDKNANVVAHFLEAPGEDFFSLKDTKQEPNVPFKGYLDKVAQITAGHDRRVIYIILLDLDSPTSFRNDANLRALYEKKMVKLYNRYVEHHPSRVILLYNKVDIPHNGMWANTNGCSNINAVRSDAMRNYPRLFFKRRFLFWDVDNFKFLPYCTGSYSEDGKSYTASGPTYPASLWKEITRLLW